MGKVKGVFGETFIGVISIILSLSFVKRKTKIEYNDKVITLITSP